MVYTFLKRAVEKYGRPVTTSEVEDVAREILPMCVDHVVHHLVELHAKGLVEKRWDGERGAFVWSPRMECTVEELAEKYPELYIDSLYYHAVREALGQPVSIEEVMEILYRISGGSSKRLSIAEVKRRLKEKRRTALIP